MGRVSESLSYQVKNTFVELNSMYTEGDRRARLKLSDASTAVGMRQFFGPQEEEEEEGHDENCGMRQSAPTQEVPNTPSPFLHPAPHFDASLLSGAYGEMLPPAFGEGAFPVGGGLPFEAQDVTGFYGMPMTMMYDPTSGSYAPCTWVMPTEGDGLCSIPEMAMQEQCSDNGAFSMQTRGQGWCPEAGMAMEMLPEARAWAHDGCSMEMSCMDHAQSSGAQDWMVVGDMAQEASGPSCSANNDGGAWAEREFDESQELKSETASVEDDEGRRPQGRQPSPEQQRPVRGRWSDVAVDGILPEDRCPPADGPAGWSAADEAVRPVKSAKAARRERERQRKLEKQALRKEQQEWEQQQQPQDQRRLSQAEQGKASQRGSMGRGHGEAWGRDVEDVETGSGSEATKETLGPSSGGSDVAAEPASDDQGKAFTTVMLRNIPNKYTREMLIRQLNEDFQGCYDFVYLPIDFKNKCNVGYGFINFCTPEICEKFVSKFDGVDVRTCLPGLNSRKVAEVTPARVQGFDENVRRLRNGPVMGELMLHPEWMPLLLDENGKEKPFPLPTTPCPPSKPRRRTGTTRDDCEQRGERESYRVRKEW